MDIVKLWNEKRWLFFLLLPVVIVVFFMQFYQKWQVHKADEAIDNAEKKDKELDSKIRQKDVEAAEVKARIEEKEKQMDERRPEDVPLDWHKHFKD